MVDAAQRLGALDRLLHGASDAAALQQYLAGCRVLESLGSQCQGLALERGDAFKIAGALALAFGSGLALLQEALRVGDPTMRRARLLQQLTADLPAVASVLLTVVHPQHQAAAAAAFVRTVGRPQAVLPWLLAVSRGLMQLHSSTNGECNQGMLGSRCTCCMLCMLCAVHAA